MIILQGDNRRLLSASKYTFLATNYASGVTSLSVLNATDSDFSTGVPILLGDIGSENAEIVYISSVDPISGFITISLPTLFPHSESSRVSVLPYDKIRYFWTPDTNFAISNPLTGYIPIQVSDWYTSYSDQSQSTGYGWYCFYNSLTTLLSQPSNYIPYTGFENNTTEDLLGDFFSLLNNKELTLVTREDALSWASEGYSRVRNKLNLTNVEYTASDVQTLPILAGVNEYDLPNDFDHLVAMLNRMPINGSGGNTLYNFQKANIEFIPLRLAYSYTGRTLRYYVRGMKLGFVPTPFFSTNFFYLYLKKAERLTSNTDQMDLPNNGFYVVKDWMMYRAYMKFQNPLAQGYLKGFTDGLNDMIIAAVVRDASLPAFGITPEANV